MRVVVHLDHGGGDHEAAPRYLGDRSLLVAAGALCPNADCDSGSSAEKPLLVAGVRGTTREERDVVWADAGCRSCGKTVGRVEVKLDTIFGIEEDRAVLQGRCRVY